MDVRVTTKKAEHGRTDAFELWCWRRLFRVSWTARRSNQLILKEIDSEYSLEGLMLKLKLQYFGHLIWRANLLGKTMNWASWRARGEGDDRTRWLDGITDSMDMNLTKLQETAKDRAGHAAVHEVTKSRTQLSDWTTRDVMYNVINIINTTVCYILKLLKIVNSNSSHHKGKKHYFNVILFCIYMR